MKKYIYLFIALLFLLPVNGCNRDKKNKAILISAQQLMTDRPDSSLKLLQQIHPENIAQRRYKALYALLYSQAKDKNAISETNDSLIDIAVQYYDKQNDMEKRFLSYYYQGRVLANSGNYTNAIVSYTMAKELADFIDNDLAIGNLYAQIGITYGILYNFAEAINQFHLAAEYYRRAESDRHITYSHIYLGELYYSTNRLEESEEQLSQAIEWTYQNDDYFFCQKCVEYLSLNYNLQKDTGKLEKLFNSKYYSICQENSTLLQSKAYLAALKGEEKKAQQLLDEARACSSNTNDTILVNYTDYQIDKRLGNYKEALQKHEEIFYLQDSSLRIALQHPLYAAQRDYFESESKYHQLELEHNHQIQIYLAVFTILIIIILILTITFYRKRIKYKESEVDNYIKQVDNLQTSLMVNQQSYQEKNDEMNNQINQLKATLSSSKDEVSIQNQNMLNMIDKLFGNQFKLLNTLASTYYDSKDTTKGREMIYMRVRDEVTFFTDTKNINRLEEIVNKCKDDIMTHTRESMPKFSEDDFTLLCFIFAGFSAKAISIFTGVSTSSIYTKKARLKTRIADSDSPYKSKILENLA